MCGRLRTVSNIISACTSISDIQRTQIINPEDKIIDIIKKRYLALVPVAVIALSYMILNFAGSGNITEFGHNYLPEFTRSELGQFNIGYMAEILPKNMFSVPKRRAEFGNTLTPTECAYSW